MDKQPFDHIENSIRQAAEHVSPPFNEEAWKKMELMLDKEQGKKRRPLIWWYLIFSGLLIGSLTFYYVYHSIQVPQRAIEQSLISVERNTETKDTHNEASLIKELAGEKELMNRKMSGKAAEKENLAVGPTNREIVAAGANHDKGQTAPHVSRDQQKNLPGTKMRGNSNDAAVAISDRQVINRDVPPARSVLTGQGNGSINNLRLEQPALTSIDSSEAKSAVIPTLTGTSTDTLSKQTITNKAIKRPDSAQNMPPVTLSSPKIPNQRGFYVIVSAGMDAVSIRKISLHRFQPVYGGSIGYRFNKNLSIQTGFYAGKRIYTAGSDDYSVKTGSYIAKIISADADCFIYDLPLNIRFDFVTTKKSNVFVSTGLSSYLLKRETYDMHFFNPMGMYRHMVYTYKTNKNFFSVYNLSVGYERKLNTRFSVLAEPYLKLPLSGVGEGRVKLYDTGLQLGFKYQPFVKSTSKKRSK